MIFTFRVYNKSVVIINVDVSVNTDVYQIGLDCTKKRQEIFPQMSRGCDESEGCAHVKGEGGG